MHRMSARLLVRSLWIALAASVSLGVAFAWPATRAAASAKTALAAASVPAGSGTPAAAPAASAPVGIAVLDTAGFWRMHHTLEAPVIDRDGKITPMDLRWVQGTRVLQSFLWASRKTDPPPKDWTAVEFDDTPWLRGPARMSCLTPLLSRLCMRGRFIVNDPAKCADLQLGLAYRGGVIVYMNGQEVARRDLAPEVAGREALACGYEADAFTPAGGWDGKASAPARSGETDKDLSLRVRTAELTIPARLLRKGANVLAVEIVRAPYDKVVEEMKGKRGSRYCPYTPAFNTCQIDRVQLRAPAGDGLVPVAVRPAGFQVWNTNTLNADFDLDFGDGGPLLPIRLVGARNGRYSGKVVVGSAEPIRQLRAEAGDLSGPAGTILASAVRIRYGLPWGSESGVNGQRTIYLANGPEFRCYPRFPTMLGALSEVAPDEIAVRTVASRPADLSLPGQAAPVFGAVAPVWVTVDVPKGARAGLYRGQITIRAEGEAPRTAALELDVVDYTLPDPQDYRTIMELIQSPDTLMLEYGVKPWSPEHFDLIARSFKLMHEVGVPIVYVPLIAQTNHGNEESMVRWIKTDAGYDWDFSAMDKYLDLAGTHMGKPQVVCFIAWDIYLGGPGGGYKDHYSSNQASVKERMRFIGKGPLVTLLDPNTRQTRTDTLPPYDDPAGSAAWAKLFTELRRRMATRGWEKAMMVGLLSDDWPTDAERKFYSEVTGDLPWVSHSHVPVTRDTKGADANGVIVTVLTAQGDAKVNRVGFRVGFHSAVLSCSFPDNDQPLGSMRGWSRPDLGCYQPRYEGLQPASRWRSVMEINITGRQRGVGRGGADLWPAVRDRGGRRVGTVSNRYPQSAWRNLDIPWCVFAPGPAGPVSTHRFEALREGIQECQARILIEDALANDKLRPLLGEGLSKRCEVLLVERTEYMLKAYGHLQINNQWGHLTGPGPICRQDGVIGHRWFVASGWQERSRRLYQAAGEVAANLARK